MSMRWLIPVLLAATLAGSGAGPARAQIALPRLPGGLPTGLPDRLPVDPDRLQDDLRARADRTLQAPGRLRDLVRRSGGALEADPHGWPVVRGEIVAVDLSPAGREAALAAGFTVVREERLDDLDLAVAVLAPPRRMSLARALERLRDLDPEGDYAFNHVHAPAGAIGPAAPAPPAARPPARAPQASGPRLGLIDAGVDAAHPALAGASIRQRGFAGPVRAAPHGTAVASLLVGRAGAFAGAAPGAALLAADVYGGSPAGGSSTAVAQALAWLAGSGVPVINVSLVGPRNALVEAAVRRVQARGVVVVAAVGNDGPAAPPLYPAAYAGVIGVAPVDARGRALPEAGRGPQVDFAAPGADMAAAGARGYVSVRGASFAAPLVAGLLARRPGGDRAVAGLAALARDAGPRGPDPVYGQGLVGLELRVAPAAVGARGSLRR